jgi:deoxyribonuclease-1
MPFKILPIFILSFLSLTFGYGNQHNFSNSKKLLLKQVYHDHKIDFYCDNPYEIVVVNGKEKTLLIPDASKYTPRKPSQPTSTFVNWEHIVPASKLGAHLPCWKEGGRKGCHKDRLFNEMESDMHNLAPSIAEINSDRGNLSYGDPLPNTTQYGNCKAQADFKNKLFYPKEDIRGDIARAYFYMSNKYKIPLLTSDIEMFKRWDKSDLVSSWERIKNKRVEKIQGNANPYIK